MPDDVVVVGIDDETFSELNERWLFSRRTFARALSASRATSRARSSTTSSSPSTSDDIEADDALVLATRRAGNVVLSATEVARTAPPRSSAARRARSSRRPRLATACSRRARRARCGGCRTRSTASRRCRSPPSSGRRAARSTARSWRGEGAWIDFSGPPGHIRYVPFSRAVSAQLRAGHVPRPDRGHRRGRAVAPGPPPDLLARGRDGGPGDPRRTRSTPCCAARRCTTSGGPADLLIAIGLRCCRSCSASGCGPSSRSASALPPRVLYAVVAQLAFGARADPAGGRAADRAGHRAGRRARRALPDRVGRARADARPVLALRARLGGRPGARARRHRGRRAPRRRAAHRDRAVQRPARLHDASPRAASRPR